MDICTLPKRTRRDDFGPALGVDSSRAFDTELALAQTRMEELIETAPRHLGDMIDQRQFGDNQGDTGYIYVLGGSAGFQRRTGDTPTYDKLSMWRSSYEIVDYDGGVREHALKMRRDISGKIRPWVESWGREFVPMREQELISCLIGGEYLDGGAFSAVCHDGLPLISAVHVLDNGNSANVAESVRGQTYSNKLELSGTYPTASGWTKEAAEAAYTLATKTCARYVNDKGRRLNIMGFSTCQVLIDSADTTDKNVGIAFHEAFTPGFGVLSGATAYPYKGKATVRETSWLWLSDRIYFVFTMLGLDGGKVNDTSTGPFGISVHVEPETLRSEEADGNIKVYVQGSWAYFPGQWQRIIEVRLNGAASSSAP